LEKKKLTLKEIGFPKLIIMLTCGVLLIVLSFPNLLTGGDSKKNVTKTADKIVSQQQVSEDSASYETQMEERLKETLKMVEGIGDVEVMITLKSSKEKITLKDSPSSQENLSETDNQGGKRTSSSVDIQEETILTNDGSGETIPYVIKELEPEIEGVAIVAEGGGSQKIVKEIVEAVEVLFDVPAHKIKVMKMNSK
jgi:stage III sporulation protein AG